MSENSARQQRSGLKSLLLPLALLLTGCAHASALRYTFTPCNPRFQETVKACFYEAAMMPPTAAYDYYADSGVIEKHWKVRYESCMFRRGYNQVAGPSTWIPKERFNGATGWPWPSEPPTGTWTWVRTAGTGDRHYYDAVCEPGG